VPIDKQETTESERKWLKVTEAIVADNQEAATAEKTKLEEEQRSAVAARLEANAPWIPKNFVYVNLEKNIEQGNSREMLHILKKLIAGRQYLAVP